ncbi:MAG: hypothetical protein VX130_07640 [Verrucomicrobiota bacterium]|nr:hypothetical protein [Verrucomicrobiota bacterium]
MSFLLFNGKLVANLMDSLIESSILINLKTISSNEGFSEGQRRYSTFYSPTDSNVTISDSISSNTTPTEVYPQLERSLTDIFSTMPNDTSLDGFDHAIHYLIELKNLQSNELNDDSLLQGVKSSIKAFLKSALDNDGGTSIEQSIESIPPRLLENFLINEQAIAQWGTGASSWVKKLGKIFMEAIVETKVDSMPENQKLGVATNSYMRSLIEVMNSENAVELKDFYPGIEPVSVSRDQINTTMKFDGEVDHFKFDPVKSRVFRTASEGLAYGAYDSLKSGSSDINKTNLDSFASNALSSLLDYLNEDLNGDHSLFSYEVARAVSLGLTLATVASTTTEELDLEAEFQLPEITAKSISNILASTAIETGIDDDHDNLGIHLGRLSESVATGSAMGAQLAAVLEKSMDYEDGWESFSRTKLAKAVSEGSSTGAITSSALSAAPRDDGQESLVDIEDIKQVASHSALGSIVGNTALAIYYPTPVDRLNLIRQSSEGSSFGSTTVLELNNVDKPPESTEDVSVEIARASAHGSTLGASFEIVALTEDANPEDKSYDSETISAVEAAAYGSTYGSIVGASLSGETDSVVLKQAAKQGATEGALTGAGLATGSSEDFFNQTNEFGGFNGGDAPVTKGGYAEVGLASQKSIIGAINSMNSQAAVDASTKLATKSIKTSAKDMMRLIQKFNISPRFTNPTRIFQGNKNQKLGDDFPFEDRFPVASPI